MDSLQVPFGVVSMQRSFTRGDESITPSWSVKNGVNRVDDKEDED